jgi:hypothetical protein
MPKQKIVSCWNVKSTKWWLKDSQCCAEMLSQQRDDLLTAVWLQHWSQHPVLRCQHQRSSAICWTNDHYSSTFGMFTATHFAGLSSCTWLCAFVCLLILIVRKSSKHSLALLFFFSFHFASLCSCTCHGCVSVLCSCAFFCVFLCSFIFIMR